jgi:hypothetical protein
VPVGFADIFFWAAVVKQAGAGRWVWLVFALGFAWLFLRIFGKLMRRGADGRGIWSSAA